MTPRQFVPQLSKGVPALPAASGLTPGGSLERVDRADLRSRQNPTARRCMTVQTQPPERTETCIRLTAQLHRCLPRDAVCAEGVSRQSLVGSWPPSDLRRPRVPRKARRSARAGRPPLPKFAGLGSAGPAFISSGVSEPAVTATGAPSVARCTDVAKSGAGQPPRPETCSSVDALLVHPLIGRASRYDALAFASRPSRHRRA